jgi:hypothetical protein
MLPARTVAGVAFMWIAGEGGTILDGVGYKAGKSDTPPISRSKIHLPSYGYRVLASRYPHLREC